MKQCKLFAIFSTLLLFCSLMPGVSAVTNSGTIKNKSEVKVYAIAQGTASGLGENPVSITVNMYSMLSKTVDGSYEGPAILKIKTTERSEIVLGMLHCNLIGKKGIEALFTRFQSNEPSIHITYDNVANQFVTDGDIITFKDKSVTLNLVWNFVSEQDARESMGAYEGSSGYWLTAKGKASVNEMKVVPISVDLLTIVSKTESGNYVGPALLRLQIVGSEKQGEILRGKFFVSIDPDAGSVQSLYLEVNDQILPMVFDSISDKWITETHVTLSNNIDLSLSLEWKLKDTFEKEEWMYALV